jgi:hypothetical protein
MHKAVDVAGYPDSAITWVQNPELLHRVVVLGRAQVSARTTGGRAPSFENLQVIEKFSFGGPTRTK